MAGSLRIEFPNAVDYITSRGNTKQVILINEGDNIKIFFIFAAKSWSGR